MDNPLSQQSACTCIRLKIIFNCAMLKYLHKQAVIKLGLISLVKNENSFWSFPFKSWG